MDAEIKHLEMIQGVISRQAKNSFQCKALAIILLTGLAGLSVSNITDLLILGVGVVLIFWLLDAYYLSKERLFRNMYERIAIEGSVNMSLSPAPKDRTGHAQWNRSMIAHTEWLLYGAILVGILIISISR